MGKKKKIAIVIATMNVGGAQKVIIDILRQLLKTQHTVRLFVHEDKKENQFTKELDSMGADVVYIHRDDHVSWKSYRGLSSALSAYCPDVVHIHLDLIYAPLWSLLHKKRTVFTIHSQPYRIFNKKGISALFKMLMKRKHFTLTGVSQQISKEAAQLLKVDISCVKTICNPVQTVDFIPYESREKVVFVNVARFAPIKNHFLLIKSFKRVKEACKTAVLKLAGDGQLLEECRCLVEEMGLSDCVTFLGNVTDVYTLLSQADVFVLSSDSEAMPISILEAMACALPVVATRVGGVAELVGEDNGLLVPPKDEVALANAMVYMADDAQFRYRCGEASFRRAANFSAERIASEYLELYFSNFHKEVNNDDAQ